MKLALPIINEIFYRYSLKVIKLDSLLSSSGSIISNILYITPSTLLIFSLELSHITASVLFLA